MATECADPVYLLCDRNGSECKCNDSVQLDARLDNVIGILLKWNYSLCSILFIWTHNVMERSFETQLCLGSGIAFLILLFFISLPNGFVLFVLLKNPLRCSKRGFSVFLAFICAMDLFVGVVVSSGEALTRFLCVFRYRGLPQDGDVLRILGYIGVNSSILLVTAMSIERFIAVVFPHTYRQKLKPKAMVVVNLCIVIFSSIFASIQLSDISLDVYLTTDLHLHTTFPLCTTSIAYLGIFLFLKKQSRIVRQNQMTVPMGSSLNDRRQERKRKMETKFAITSFLILLFLILSLIPYFTITIIGIHCESCSEQHWFLALKESSIVFLFLNSVINPFLASFRISELRKSCAIVLGWQRQDIETTPSHFLFSAMRCEVGDTANQAAGRGLENL